MEFLQNLNFDGLAIGILTFVIIGISHPAVTKGEYYFGTKIWWAFLILGIAGIVVAVLVENITASAILGVFAFTCLWGIKEIFEQEERVRKGWFPRNPKRKYRFDDPEEPKTGKNKKS